jgi:hypothetical protein
MALRRPRRAGSRRRPARPSGERPERSREPDSGPDRAPRRDLRGDAKSAAGPLLAGAAEVVAIGREMVQIPIDLWMRAAEWLGARVLAVALWLWPLLLGVLAQGRRLVDLAARELTPARATAAVALAAAALLAASQFADYREVRAGVPAYAEVEQVAPPPTVDGSRETAGSAHLYVLLLVAIAAAAIVVLSMLGRWRLARLLFPLGIVAVAVAVLIDAPAGLDEGVVATQFQGAEARLLGPFWVQVAAGAVIALCGALLARMLRPNPERRRAGAPAPGRARLGRSRVQGAQS